MVLDADVHVADRTTVNGINLSDLVKKIVKINDDGNMGDVTFDDVVRISNSSVMSYVNNDTMVSFDDYFKSCVHLNLRQNISSSVVIRNNVSVRGNIQAR